MRINRLQLYHFRNYARLELRPDSGLCVLTGPNAAGKTNILEAVFLCALGRSHRTSHDGELIRNGVEEGLVELELETSFGRRVIRIELRFKERKRVFLDGQPIERSGELMGALNVVMFSPEDLALVKDGPAERRRFLDMELSQLQPAYYYTLQQYNAALKQRNILLKDPDMLSSGTLEQWDVQLSRLGASITISRANFCEELKTVAKRLHDKMSGGKEQLSVAYRPSLPAVPQRQLCEAMQDALLDSLERDLYRGFTSVGPHKDDIALALDGLDVRTFGSQGQQRTTALSLKLSEIELTRRIRGENPVLLLDDVFSELDAQRQALLLKTVEGCQTFVSCTHLEELAKAGAGQMQVYGVNDGSVVEI
ncbi:MAG: DNA replication/repair protein RecF [Clostridia bacterium]|nr:DNA replication/repair protein RecF [Clostridia bacterium]